MEDIKIVLNEAIITLDLKHYMNINAAIGGNGIKYMN